MTNTELNRAIRALAEELAEGVIRAIVALPLRELAAVTRAEVSASVVRRERPAARTRTAKTSRTKPAPARTSRSAPTDTRTLSRQILAILQRSKAWMTSTMIKRELAGAPDRHTIFQALRTLHDEDLVAKRGSTSAMEYQVTRKGLDAGA